MLGRWDTRFLFVTDSTDRPGSVTFSNLPGKARGESANVSRFVQFVSRIAYCLMTRLL